MLVAVLFRALLQVFMLLAGFVQLRSFSASFSEATLAAIEQPLNYALVPAAAMAVVFFIAFPHRKRDAGLLDAVHVRPLLGGVVALCFVAGLFLQLPFAELGNLVQEVWPLSFEELARRHRFVNPTTWWGGITALLAVVLVAPVTEELLFRGWLMRDLDERYGAAPALVWSSLLFGMVHGLSGMLYATVGGLVLGAIALRTKSTLGSIAAHAGVNALPLLVPVSIVRIEGFNTLSSKVEHISAWLVLLSLAGAGAALAVLWRVTGED